MHKENKQLWSVGITVLVGLFFSISIVLPLVSNLLKINWNDIPEVIGTTLFKDSLKNSLGVSLAAAAVSLFIAFALAYIIERTQVKYKRFWKLIMIIPMLIPSISHGMGLINLFGDNGLVTVLLGVDINLYGFNGILIGSVMYTFPIAFLMLADTFHYMDMDIYEAARVLGIPKKRILLDLTLKHLKKPLIATYFALFTMIFTDYGVPLAVGGKFSTLAVFLYREVVGLLDFSKGGFIALILLVPTIISFLIDSRIKDSAVLTTSPRPITIKMNPMRDNVCLVVCILGGLAILFPIASCILVAFVKAYPRNLQFSMEHVEMVLNMKLGKYLWHSIVIAMSTALVGTMVAYIIAYRTTRSKSPKVARSLYVCSLLPLVVPGMVLGLGYVQVFGGTALYGTVFILILVNVIHFFSSPYLMAYNALRQVSVELEQMGKTLGIRQWRMVKDVIVPTTKETIIEMFSYFFVNAMITISAVSFLYNTSNMPLSLMINQLEGQVMLEGASVVSIVILLVNVIFKVLVYGVKKYIL